MSRELGSDEHQQQQHVLEQHYDIKSRQHGRHSPRKAGINFSSVGKLRARLDADEWMRPPGEHRKGKKR